MRFLEKLAGHRHSLLFVVALLLLGLLADWSENISILAMIINYPGRIPALGHYLGVITPIKWFIDILAGFLASSGILWLLIGHSTAFLRHISGRAR